MFTSNREQGLWLWALTVVVAIYSTLGRAAIAEIGWKKDASRLELWVAIGVAAAYAMVVVRMGIPPAERTHLFEYGLVAVLIHGALVGSRRSFRTVSTTYRT